MSTDAYPLHDSVESLHETRQTFQRIRGHLSNIDDRLGDTTALLPVVSFKTIDCPSGTDPVADTSNDTLTLASGNAGLTISGDSTTDTITFTAVPGSGGMGDVIGPASSTNNAIALWNGTTGKLLKNSTVTIDSSGTVTVPNTEAVNFDTSATRILNGGTGVLWLQSTSGLRLQGDTNNFREGEGAATDPIILSIVRVEGQTSSDNNYLVINNCADASPTIPVTATGSAANLNINMVPKGTGHLQEAGVNVLTTSTGQPLDATLTDLAALSAVQGDIIYASGNDDFSLLNKNTTATRYLSNTGASNNPAWAQVDLTNGVTGALPIGNGGTGQTTAANARAALGAAPADAVYVVLTSNAELSAERVTSFDGDSGVFLNDTGTELYFRLDINGLTADATPDGAADYVATWDASASKHKKVLLDDLPGGSTLPVVDTTSIAEGSSDNTKEVRFECDTNIPTTTVVVLTVPKTSGTVVTGSSGTTANVVMVSSGTDGTADPKVAASTVGTITFGDGTERDIIPDTDLKENLGTSSKRFNDLELGGKANLSGGGTGQAPLNLTPSAAPTSPVEGDFWNDSTQETECTFQSGMKSYRVGLLYCQVTSKNVNTTASETTLVDTTSAIGTNTFAANYMAAGKSVRFRASGVYSTTGSPTLQFRLRWGAAGAGTVLLDTGAQTVTGATNRRWEINVVLTALSTTSLIGQGAVSINTTSAILSALWEFSTGSAAIGSLATVATALTLSCQWGTSSASNNVTCTNMTIEAVG